MHLFDKKWTHKHLSVTSYGQEKKNVSHNFFQKLMWVGGHLSFLFSFLGGCISIIMAITPLLVSSFSEKVESDSGYKKTFMRPV